MLDNIIAPIKRFLEHCRMRVELKRLRANDQLEQILHDADYKVIYGDQGDDFIYVYHKENRSRDSDLFFTYSYDEAVWWIVQRHREENEGKFTKMR